MNWLEEYQRDRLVNNRLWIVLVNPACLRTKLTLARQPRGAIVCTGLPCAITAIKGNLCVVFRVEVTDFRIKRPSCRVLRFARSS